MFKISSESWRRGMLVLLALEALLAIVLLGLGSNNTGASAGYDPYQVVTASANFLIAAVINTAAALACFYLLFFQTFFAPLALVAHLCCAIYISVNWGFAAYYLSELNLSDPWLTHSDVCYEMDAYSGKRCEVDKTYIVAFAFAPVLIIVDLLAVIGSILGHKTKSLEIFSKPASQFFTTLRHPKRPSGVEGKQEMLHEETTPYVDTRAGPQGSEMSAAEEVRATTSPMESELRTFWENGVQYKVVPVTGATGLPVEWASGVREDMRGAEPVTDESSQPIGGPSVI